MPVPDLGANMDSAGDCDFKECNEINKQEKISLYKTE